LGVGSLPWYGDIQRLGMPPL